MSSTPLSDLSIPQINLILKKLHLKAPGTYDEDSRLELLRVVLSLADTFQIMRMIQSWENLTKMGTLLTLKPRMMRLVVFSPMQMVKKRYDTHVLYVQVKLQMTEMTLGLDCIVVAVKTFFIIVTQRFP